MDYRHSVGGRILGVAAAGLAALLSAGNARAQEALSPAQQLGTNLAEQAELAKGYECDLAGTSRDGVMTCSDDSGAGIVGVVKGGSLETLHFLSGDTTTKTEVYNNDVLQSTTTFQEGNPLVRETYAADGETVVSRDVNEDGDAYFDRADVFSADGVVTRRVWMEQGIVRRAEGYEGKNRLLKKT